jgi:hypothetical protein
LSRPHLQQHPLKKGETEFYAITLGFDLSSITKVNAALNMSIHFFCFLLATSYPLPATFWR